MLFVHLSDIHFNNLLSFDPDQGTRDALLDDLDRQLRAIGREADAILVPGDIAFGGKAADYALAATWLEDVCKVAGCSPQSVMVCPGNHDVDQEVAAGALVSGLRAQLRGPPLRLGDPAVDWSDHDRRLEGFMSDRASAVELGKPLVDYNDFASRFGCGCDPSAKQLFWEKEFPLGSLRLSIRGINSALISSREDTDENLYVGGRATLFRREPDVARLVMCHHPTSWLMDGIAVRDRLNVDCQVQLFGHEHDSRVVETPRYIQVFAGALQPERTSPPWAPAYNLISIEEATGQDSPCIAVEVIARDWQPRPPQFVTHFFEDGAVTKRCIVTLPLARRPRPAVLSTPAGPAHRDSPGPPATAPQVAADGNARGEGPTVTTDEDAARLTPEIAWRFFRLPPHRRRSIISGMGLVVMAEEGLPDFARMEHSLRRAEESGRVVELVAEVGKAEATIGGSR